MPDRRPNGGADRLALRRRQEARWPPVLHGAFRPFFLCCAIWFPLALLGWVGSLAGLFAPASALGPLGWHRHELLFGGAGAAVAGYVLTATPNWSGQLPANGGRLLAMLLWWAVARVANAWSLIPGAGMAAVIDTGFFIALAAACGREAWHGRGRGGVQVILLLLLAAACAASHAAASGAVAPDRAASQPVIAVLAVLISVVAGRIVPSFTRNALPPHRRGSLSAEQTWFDWGTHAITAAALIAWLAGDGIAVRAGLLTAAGVQAVRVVRWGGWRVRHHSSAFALHLGYAWLPLGLAMLAMAPSDQGSAALHALTAGAIPAMILAVMARVTITQTGRLPRFAAAPVAAVALVSVGAMVRIASGGLVGDAMAGWTAAAVVWTLGFAVFLAAFTESLCRPRKLKSAN